MKVLGISAFFHDAAAALLVDGVVVAAAEEERFTRDKHDRSFPERSIEFCLERAGLDPDQLDVVVFYEKPLLKFERIITTHLRNFPGAAPQFIRSMKTWLGDRLWLKSKLAAELGLPARKILFSEHHVSHAAAAFYPSGFEDAAIVVVDGVGEWACTSIFNTKDGQIQKVQEQHFPHSIGLLYSALTAYLGFEVNSGEYKVMGLAAYGEPRFLDQLRLIASWDEDAVLSMDMRYFSYDRDPEKSFTEELEKLLGPCRRPGRPINLHNEEGQRFADIAASIQMLAELYMLNLCRVAKKVTGRTSLCLGGGVALNVKANQRIAESGLFDRFHVHPASGDAGGALGAALWANQQLGGSHELPLQYARLGEAHDKPGIVRFLDDCGIKYEVLAEPGALFARAADALSQGQVGGWVQGGFEWGPRALGARSIVADPRDKRMMERINRAVKFREPFRPFAPAVLSEDFDLWFEAYPLIEDDLSAFMCGAYRAKPCAKEKIPAVVHADDTARAQRVEKTNFEFHGLIEAFKQRTGVGVLLNTSFNLNDEPICNSPAEACLSFFSSDLDFLVLGDIFIERSST